MPKRPTGFRVEIPDEAEFRVADPASRSTHYPKGLYLHGGRGVGVWLHYAGLGDDSPFGPMRLPADAAALRALSDVLLQMADKVEVRRPSKRRP